MKSALRSRPPASTLFIARTKLEPHGLSPKRRGARARAGLVIACGFIAACTLTSGDFEPQPVQSAPLLPGAPDPATDCGGVECCDVRPCPGTALCRDGVCAATDGGAPSAPTCHQGLDCVGAMNVVLATSCDDDVQNGDETGIDCGGGCPSCADGNACGKSDDCASKVCRSGECAPPSCTDQVGNGDETDADCGGSCSARCAAGRRCAVDDDCESGTFCATTKLCTNVSCSDGVKNGVEVLADCGGGVCPGCPAESPCSTPADCDSRVCDGNVCAAATCTDGTQNQNETAVDCGGSCPQNCGTGQGCSAGGDCQSQVCRALGCAEGLAACCQAATCGDRVRNGPESGVDCGGPFCGRCPDLATCRQASDCGNNNCDDRGICISCGDGALDGTETDIDCGGSDPACRRCTPGERCRSNDDCQSTQCVGGIC